MSSYPTSEIQELDGPEYVTVVLEWDDLAWNDEDEPTRVRSRRPRASGLTKGRTIATAVGALSALALATWGLARLRSAS